MAREKIESLLREDQLTLAELEEKSDLKKRDVLLTLKELRSEGRLKVEKKSEKNYYSMADKRKKDFKTTIIRSFKKDWLTIAMIILIIALGIVVRLIDYSEVGYWNDDLSTIPTGVAWFYPTQFHPSLIGHGEPALGNWFIGAGCKLSGEDFSGVTQMQPNWFVGRSELIGRQMVKAEAYCHLPIHIAGILFLIIIAILAYMIIGRYGAVFTTAFFAFYPVTLEYARWIHVDGILWVFIGLALIFLWKVYTTEKGSKKEMIYLLLMAVFLALASATKFSAGFFVIFSYLIILIKYKQVIFMIVKLILEKATLQEIAKKIRVSANAMKEKVLIVKNIIVSGIVFFILFLLPFDFKPSLIIQLIKQHHAIYPELSTLGFYASSAIEVIYKFLLRINVIDTILIIGSLYVLYKLIRKRNKSSNEMFILYLVGLFIVSIFTLKTLTLFRIAIPYLIGVILMASMIFSEKGSYSILSKLKPRIKDIAFIVFILIYVGYSAGMAISDSPYYLQTNPIVCAFDEEGCQTFLDNNRNRVASKAAGQYLNERLKDDETYLSNSGIIYVYTRPEENTYSYYFKLPYRQKYGREPSIQDYITDFKPLNRTLRYIVLEPAYRSRTFDRPDEKEFLETYEPNDIINLAGGPAYLVFDVKDLRKKSS